MERDYEGLLDDFANANLRYYNLVLNNWNGRKCSSETEDEAFEEYYSLKEEILKLLNRGYPSAI